MARAKKQPILTDLEEVLAGWQGRLADTLGEVARRRFAPPPRQTVDQWAREHRYLPETAAEPGRWNPMRAPYQSGIMQAFTSPAVRTITVQSASQVGKSTIMTNCLGYVIDRMPAASLWLMPSLASATDFMKEVVRPMLEASPALLAKTRRQGPPNYRRILFENGYCVFSGGASAINLASRAIKVLFCDEIDKLRYAIKNEGDPLSLILKRLSTYADSKALFASTPTVSGGSRIERLFGESSMSRWYLKCPSGECDGWQELVWEDLDFKTVCLKCQACDGLFTQGEWQRSSGEWRESVPNPAHKGFFISGLASPWTDWGDLIKEFLVANRQAQVGDFGLLQSWRTGRLGIAWEQKVETTRAQDLWTRREVYEGDT
jgi:phage terminase large subunit GpA-like protein